MNYYDILEVDISSSEKDIKKAYKRLVKKYHPDVYTGDINYSEKKIKEINEAYEVLSDPILKENYDNALFSDGSNEQDYDDSKNNPPSQEQKYEDLYKYDYYNRKYTTNYYGVNHESKANSYSYHNDSEDNIFKGTINSFIDKLSPGKLLLLVIIFVLLFILILNITFNQNYFNLLNTTTPTTTYNSTTTNENIENNNSINNQVIEDLNFPVDTTYDDIVTQYGKPLFQYNYLTFLIIEYESHIFIFNENNYLIDWY